jgi:SAM-dependent methyltransferase
MNAEDNYLEINRESWNRRTEVHLTSEFYGVEAFLKGKTSLNEIELSLLGDVRGRSILHLQCHFGQDSISLSRLGAQVTGVDLSDKAIESAMQLAEKARVDTRFICCDVYSLPAHLNDPFDLVFASYGTIGWFPDLDRWAGVVSKFLKPGGQLVFAEFHPFVWMFDNDFQKVAYNYFNTGAIVETEDGTYADRSAPIRQQYVSWNHPISEVLNSLLAKRLSIDRFNEYDYSPYNCFNDMVEVTPGRYRIRAFGDKVPLVYALLATPKP